jgi:hypothetical protein
MTLCPHRWEASTDSYGVQGSPTWTVWHCRKCGDETTEQPEDWEPDIDADTAYERARDDRVTGDWFAPVYENE